MSATATPARPAEQSSDCSVSPCLHRHAQPARRCAAEGCETWLSSFNPTDVCAPCGGWRVKATRPEQRDSLQDLMAAAA